VDSGDGLLGLSPLRNLKNLWFPGFFGALMCAEPLPVEEKKIKPLHNLRYIAAIVEPS